MVQLALDAAYAGGSMRRGLELGAAGVAVPIGPLVLCAQGPSDGLLALPLRLGHEGAPLVVVLLEGVAGLSAAERVRLEVGGVAAVEQPCGPRRSVDVQHGGDGAGQELAVVADDDESRSQGRAELLEPLQPGEVQVVGRLVEQEHVVARQQDRGQTGAGRLAAGQGHRLGVEQVCWQAEVGADLQASYVQIGPAQVQPALEGGAVGVVRTGRLFGERRGRGVEGELCRPDAGTPGQERGERLPGSPVRLLRQQTHRGRRRRERHRARIRGEQPGQGREQRRLARTVGTHHTEPGLRGDRERDLGQDRGGAAGDGDAAGDESRAHERRTAPRSKRTGTSS